MSPRAPRFASHNPLVREALDRLVDTGAPHDAS